MAKKSIIRGNWPKYVLQWGVLAALVFFLSGLAVKIFPKLAPVNPEAYCPFGGLEALATYLQRASLPCSMTTVQIVMGVCLAAAVILLSKLFCAYLCPIGTIEDLLLKARRSLKINGMNIRSGSVADKILRIVKYALLFWIVYMTVSSSELFCKNIDPYYAVATGFKGEITLWMSLTALGIVLLLGFFINRFWCKYICPLGAISNTLKFWTWLLALVLLWWALYALGLRVSWVWYLGSFCLLGYLLEIFNGRPKLQLMHVVLDEDHCGRSCYSCRKNCPYHIDIPSYGSVMNSVDCTLCGDCVAACPTKALSIAVTPSGRTGWQKYIPPVFTALLLALALIFGGKFEIPTISETWGVEEGMTLSTLRMEDVFSVKCYGSSMALKARMEKVDGVHGVKTYVGSHTIVLSYDPSVISEDELRRQVFVPSRYKIAVPDPDAVPELNVYTLRVEKMFDKLDLAYLGLQFKNEQKGVYGLESEYDCPVVVRVYVDPAFKPDADWFRQIVNRRQLVMTFSNGTQREFPMGLEFVRMNKEVETIPSGEFIERMSASSK